MPKQPTSPARIIKVVTEWFAVTNPVHCECGHLHYGRVSYPSGQAPQWHFCEEEKCNCKGLRPAAVTARR